MSHGEVWDGFSTVRLLDESADRTFSLYARIRERCKAAHARERHIEVCVSGGRVSRSLLWYSHLDC